MFNFEAMRKKCLLWATLIFVCLNSQFSYAQVTDKLPLDDPNTVIQSIISALKTIKHPQTGRGRAVLRTENYLPPQDDKDLVVDFVFKDQNSRMEIFEPDRTGGFSKIRAQIKNRQKYY
jgi:hypothetical protein